VNFYLFIYLNNVTVRVQEQEAAPTDDSNGQA
jgi:hypothetical protein